MIQEHVSCRLIETIVLLLTRDNIKTHANGPNIIGPNNVVTCCVRLHGTTTMLALVAYSLKPVKLLGPCKRMQHCWPTTTNNVESCSCLLRSFAWAFRLQKNSALPLTLNFGRFQMILNLDTFQLLY